MTKMKKMKKMRNLLLHANSAQHAGLTRLLIAVCLLLPAMVAHADVVTDWNKIMTDTMIVDDFCLEGRSNAITQLAVFEAVNAIVGDYHPYLGTISAPPGASPEAAAIAAAHRTLVTLYPAQAPNLDAAEATSLAAIPDGQPKTDGIAVGEAAAEAMLALRANDGWDRIVDYIPGTDPGDWRPTPPAYLPALRPGWGLVTPFAMVSGSQFRTGAPPALDGATYARYYNEVKTVGAMNSPVRPPDRTTVALFYRLPGPQLWNQAARQMALARKKTLSQNAHDFALLAIALCDGTIATMDSKYFYSRWRPVTAIRAGDTDGNDRTAPDPNWLPLVVTPNFPSYPSAHASVAGSVRRVLERVYGKSGFTVALTSPGLPGTTLSYHTWKQITDDIDDARVYGGIHFRYDQEAGEKQGQQLGSYILANYLRRLNGDDGNDDDQ